MELNDFPKNFGSGFLFTFSLSILAMVIYLSFFGYYFVPLHDIVALFVISILISLAGIVLYSNRGLNRMELLVRHMIRLLLIMGIVLSVATYMNWITFNEPITIGLLIGITSVIYIIAIATEFYHSKKLMDKMNEKLKERNHK